MVLVVFALYASTVVYWIIGILQVFQKMAEIVYDATSLTESNISVIYRSLDDTTTVTDDSRPRVAQFAPPLEREMQWCVGTVSLTTNVRSAALIDPHSFRIHYLDWKRIDHPWGCNSLVAGMGTVEEKSNSAVSLSLLDVRNIRYVSRFLEPFILLPPSHQQ